MSNAEAYEASYHGCPSVFMHSKVRYTKRLCNILAWVGVNANPMYSIGNTRDIDSVYLNGEAVDRESLRARWQ